VYRIRCLGYAPCLPRKAHATRYPQELMCLADLVQHRPTTNQLFPNLRSVKFIPPILHAACVRDCPMIIDIRSVRGGTPFRPLYISSCSEDPEDPGAMLPLLSTVRRKPELLSLRIINAEPRGLACSNLSLRRLRKAQNPPPCLLAEFVVVAGPKYRSLRVISAYFNHPFPSLRRLALEVDVLASFGKLLDRSRVAATSSGISCWGGASYVGCHRALRAARP
jgi:hypothetical protein